MYLEPTRYPVSPPRKTDDGKRSAPMYLTPTSLPMNPSRKTENEARPASLSGSAGPLLPQHPMDQNPLVRQKERVLVRHHGKQNLPVALYKPREQVR